MPRDSLDASTLHAASAEWHQTDAETIPIPALTLLYHPDLSRIGERALLRSLTPGTSVAISRREPLFASAGRARERPLEDRHLSRSPWSLSITANGLELDPGNQSAPIRAQGTLITEAIQFSREDLASGIVIEIAKRVVVLLHIHHAAMAAAPPHFGLVGESHPIVRVRTEVERVADLGVSVLIRGETGTGKELVASALHQASRREGNFVAVNLAAIPPSLATAEFFGARKGAFTGASQAQTGYFPRADHGTLFLDEIGEAPIETQVQLLRALETGEIQTLGTQQPRPVDVRLITATDADLEELVATGSFRAPLLHRLSGFELRLPSLRQRRDDFGRLFLHFLRQELTAVEEATRFDAEDATRWLPPRLIARLAALEWPGNVRQLRNVVRQLVIGNRGQSRFKVGPAIETLLTAAKVQHEDSTRPLAAETPDAVPASHRDSRPRRRKPATVTDGELRDALRSSRWDLKATAELLNVSRTSLYALIEKHPGLRAPKDIPNEEIRRAHQACGGNHLAIVETLEISLRALRRRLHEMGLE